MVVKRSHTAANVAPALRVLRDQVNRAYPLRLQTSEGTDSDGIWPSAAHTAANPNSDHEAGNALDIDDDLSGRNGIPPQVTPEMARRLSRHPACNYTIHDARFYRDGLGSGYSGSNPHTGHVHVSVLEARRGDTTPWDIGEEDEMLPLDYRVIGLPIKTEADRTWLVLKAKTMGLSYKDGGDVFLVDAMKGAKADVFINWAKSKGYGCPRQSSRRGDAATQMLDNVGKPGPVPDGSTVAPRLEKAKQTAEAIATRSRQIADLEEKNAVDAAAIQAL